MTSILCLPHGSPPFVLYGPPVTGKTITIVEAMKQILTHKPCTCILAIAPSNSAANLMNSSDSMHPLDAKTKSLMNYSLIHIKGMVTSHRHLCISTSIPHGISVPRGHFDYIFVDKAGQVTEPEVMIGIGTVSNNETNVVLSEDPLQLRLLFALVLIMKLMRNFCLHPAILAFPNEWFYGQELQACGYINSTHAYVGSPKLPSKKFPLMFYAAPGRGEREAGCPFPRRGMSIKAVNRSSGL
ncbi:hypothetical protein BS17DRAFT_871362 [Gyrodon lividus]|nr:hypothetical protein BS17DRAFT_871362 [Gyrodon lividus]